MVVSKAVRFVGSLTRSGIVATGHSSVVLVDSLMKAALLIVVAPLALSAWGLTGVGIVLFIMAAPTTAYALWRLQRIPSEEGAAPRHEDATWVGGGYYADVFKTRDGRALKRYRPGPRMRDMVTREQHALRALARAEASRPATVGVPLPADGSDDATVAMQWVPGIQLDHVIAGRRVPQPEMAAIARGVVDSTAHFARALKQPYRDLTPMNATTDRVWLIDVANQECHLPAPEGLTEEVLTVGNYLGWVAREAAKPAHRPSLRAIRDHVRMAVEMFRYARTRGGSVTPVSVRRAAIWRYRELTTVGLLRRIWFRSAGLAGAAMVIAIAERQLRRAAA